ncbi:MAG TPA: hypothetical protein VE570_16215 [Thermoleophilaceae bacterium]|jgi:hypothetical protein|nr:hypothetical protein [Thermoleophilaceae bacterium]
MSTNNDRRGRHRQAARNLTIAVATAALAGTGAAMAADGGSAPPATKGAAGAVDAKEAAPNDRLPLAENNPVVVQARAGLGRLVADGTIEQSEADVVMQGVIGGRVEPDALVRAGKVSSAHVPAINDVLREVKRANAGSGSDQGPGSDQEKRANGQAGCFPAPGSDQEKRAKLAAGV